MARITVEDCLDKQNNRFALISLAAKRAKQLLNGADSLLDKPTDNKAVVNALREIAAGKVNFMSEKDLAERKAIEDARKAELVEKHKKTASAEAIGAELFNDDSSNSEDNSEDNSEGNPEDNSKSSAAELSASNE